MRAAEGGERSGGAYEVPDINIRSIALDLKIPGTAPDGAPRLAAAAERIFLDLLPHGS